MNLLFENFRLPGNQRKPGELYLSISDDRVVDISIYPPIKNIDKTINCEGCYLTPGLLDLQLYGGGGTIFSTSFSKEDGKKIDQIHLKAGTTRYLITVPSLSHEHILKAIEGTKKLMADKNLECLGLHLEGPWFNPKKSGGHDSKVIRKPDLQKLKKIIKEGAGVIKLITLAPEEFIQKDLEWLLNSGIPIAAGHSNATDHQARQFFDLGVRLSTHLFNAMSGMHHRDPGLATATLNDDRVFSTIIADGHHVDYSMISLTHKLKKEKLLLISDATFFGMKEETTFYHGHKVTKRDGACFNQEGRLMGSASSLLKGVQNLVRHVQIPIPEALNMASIYPARFLGDLEHGQIASGKIADILLLDEQLKIQRIYRAGQEVEFQ